MTKAFFESPWLPLNSEAYEHRDEFPNFIEWHAHSAREACDLQAQMISEYDSWKGARVTQKFADSWGKAHSVTETDYMRDTLQGAIVALARMGQTLWIANDIRDVITSAAEQLGNETLRSLDPPYDQGIVWLPVALTYWNHDEFNNAKHGDKPEDWPYGIPLIAVGWHRSTTGILVFCFTATSKQAMVNGCPKTLVCDAWAWDFDRPWTDDPTVAPDFGQANLPKPTVEDMAVYDDGEGTASRCAPWVAVTRRFLIALWRFMEQEIVLVEDEHDRHTMKRARRAGKSTGYATIKLRRVRTAHEAHEPGPVEWTCQWLVKGHWRTLHRGSDKQRKVWVRPHAKGPEDKPMKVTHNVVSIER